MLNNNYPVIIFLISEERLDLQLRLTANIFYLFNLLGVGPIMLLYAIYTYENSN